MPDRVFYSICFGFVCGVLLRSFVFMDPFFVLLAGLVASAIFLFFILVSRNGIGIMLSVFVLAFSSGVFRMHLSDIPPPYFFESKVGQSTTLSGVIVDEPAIKEANQQLIAKIDENGYRTKVLLSAGLEGDYRYGDGINFTAVLKKPENFLTEQGKVFDYVNYLRKDGIHYVMSYPDVEILSRGNGNVIKRALFSAKRSFLEKLRFTVPEPENTLLGGLILGERSSFSRELRQKFVDTGTIHIVALSGYNITIVAEWFMKLFIFLPPSFAIWAGIWAILLFVLMTGASSTALRAGIMATLALIARATGRNYDVARALVLAGLVMLLFNPLLLVYDVSFQLSFLATVAVIFLAPRVEKYFLWLPRRFGLRDVVSVTFAAYIFVFPFILYKMGNMSLVALPANVLILPLIPLTMMLGFITGAIGTVFYTLAVPLGYMAYMFLRYELWVVDFFAGLPFASLSFPDFPLWVTLLIYAWFIYRLFGGTRGQVIAGSLS